LALSAFLDSLSQPRREQNESGGGLACKAGKTPDGFIIPGAWKTRTRNLQIVISGFRVQPCRLPRHDIS
jgi:hypothetical protein